MRTHTPTQRHTRTNARPVSVRCVLTLHYIHFVCPVGSPFRLIALPKVYSSRDAWHVVSSTAGLYPDCHPFNEQTLVVSSNIWEENLKIFSNGPICIIPAGLDVFRVGSSGGWKGHAPMDLSSDRSLGQEMSRESWQTWVGCCFSPFHSDHPATHQELFSQQPQKGQNAN